MRQANWLVSCEVWPHFQGGFGDYFYLRPNHAVFKLPDDITDDMAAGVNCAFTQVYAGLDIAGGARGRDRGHPGRGRPRRVRVRGGAGDGRGAGSSSSTAWTSAWSLARSFGADEVVDMREHKTPEDAHRRRSRS